MRSLISVCMPSNRPYLWQATYRALKEYSKNVDFEIIIVGPESADSILPSNIKLIKTGNIKVPQCNEIAIRQAQGNLLLFLGDDHKFWGGGGLDNLYRERQQLCEKKGDNRLVYLANVNRATLTYPKYPITETKRVYASLHCALLDRDLLSQIKEPGYADIRFIGVYWDCDLAMRLNEVGIEFAQSPNIWCIEYRDKRNQYRLHHICKPHDINILHKLWVREVAKDDVVPSKDIWGYMKNPRWLLSKKRLDKVIRYKDDNLLTRSQGPKIISNLKWN